MLRKNPNYRTQWYKFYRKSPKAYNFRSDRDSVLQRPFANKWLNIAIAWELMLLLVIVYVPFLSDAFGTYRLPLEDWLLVLAGAFSIVPVLEVTKWIMRRLVPLDVVRDLHASA
ncbi:MAG: cation-translocating P-type ATPase C-terminal domain-containing protein [Thiohalocapsa sp.]